MRWAGWFVSCQSGEDGSDWSRSGCGRCPTGLTGMAGWACAAERSRCGRPAATTARHARAAPTGCGVAARRATDSTAPLSARTPGKARPPRPAGARSSRCVTAVRPRFPGVAPPEPVEPPPGPSPAGTGSVLYLALITGVIPVVGCPGTGVLAPVPHTCCVRCIAHAFSSSRVEASASAAFSSCPYLTVVER